jgi:hypothetical protein
MNVDGLFDRLEPEFICGPMHITTPHASSRQPHAKAVMVVVPPIHFSRIGAGRGEFDGGSSAKFASPNDQSFVQHAALFEVGEQGADWLIAFAGEAPMVLLQVIVVIPWLPSSVPYLNEAHASFQEPAGYEQLSPLRTRTIQITDGLWFLRNIEGVARVYLHPVSELEGLNSCFQLGVLAAIPDMLLVQLPKQVKLFALVAGRNKSVFDVFDQFFNLLMLRIDVGALVNPGKECALPIL